MKGRDESSRHLTVSDRISILQIHRDESRKIVADLTYLRTRPFFTFRRSLAIDDSSCGHFYKGVDSKEWIGRNFSITHALTRSRETMRAKINRESVIFISRRIAEKLVRPFAADRTRRSHPVVIRSSLRTLPSVFFSVFPPMAAFKG